MKMKAVFFAAAIAAASPAAAQCVPLVGARAVDGDTVALGDIRIRVVGINAPEMRGPCRGAAEAAKAEMQAAINAGAEACPSLRGDGALKRDKYGRILASILIDGADLGKAMIRAGLAEPYDGRRKAGKWCPIARCCEVGCESRQPKTMGGDP